MNFKPFNVAFKLYSESKYTFTVCLHLLYAYRYDKLYYIFKSNPAINFTWTYNWPKKYNHPAVGKYFQKVNSDNQTDHCEMVKQRLRTFLKLREC